MSKVTLILWLGIVVAALPYLGFPGSWKMWIFTVLGILIVLLAYLVSQDGSAPQSGQRHESDSYVENR